MKKVIIVLGVVVVLIALIAIAFYFRYQQMTKTIRSAKVERIDLEQIEDGVYSGEFGDFLVDVKLEVTIEDHKITEIEIIEQKSGPGHEATETVDRIIEAQSPLVDAVSGATGSSKCIMIAVQNALLGR